MQTSSEFESDVLDLIKSRRSRRAFSERPIELERIKSLFEAARWAPSSLNEQPWRYIYATKGQELWQKIFDALNEGNKSWAKDAQLLIVSFCKKNFSRNGSANGAAKYDVGAANAFLSLQATHLGLNTHQMGGFDHQLLRKNLNVPTDFEEGVVIAVGYAGDVDQLPSHLQQRETSPRMRNVQDEFVMNRSF
ncbi:MAG: nitroreductase family protein [Bacteroidetes bacterium]|nr:nitroreductase family protein [Bacteroidota bacterium]MBI3482198.1 nitroreductase family protein [Bacteroidota bacterium]